MKLKVTAAALLAGIMLFAGGCGADPGYTSADEIREKTEQALAEAEAKAQETATTAETTPAADGDTAEKPANDMGVEGTIDVQIDVKDYGSIVVELDPEAAPKTVENFISLVDDGFYDGLTFHRIMSGFMMQGGDPTGTGMGGSEVTIEGEFLSNGYNNPLSHTRGAISMARSGDPNSASSQFFIVHQDSTFLDGNYACFGYVKSGMEVVDAVCEAAQPTDDNGTIPAENQPIIEKMTVLR